MAPSPRTAGDAAAENAVPISSETKRKGTSRKSRSMVASQEGSAPTELILAGWDATSSPAQARAYRELEAAGVVRVAAIVALAANPTDEIAGYFPNAKVAKTLDAIIAPPGSLVVLGSPSRLRATHANAAFRRGWHVFCEPPVAGSCTEFQQMLVSARRHERTIGVDLHHRGFPAIKYIRALCRDQLLGPLLSFTVSEGTPMTRDRAGTPDGVLIEYGFRALDLVGWVVGALTIANYADDAMGGVEANALIELTCPEGVRGTVHLSRDWPTARQYEFVLELGLVRWSMAEPSRLRLQLSSTPGALDAAMVAPLVPGMPESSRQVLSTDADAYAAYLRAFLKRADPSDTAVEQPDQALEPLALIETCYARRTLLDQPWLTRNEAARARSLSVPSVLRRP